MDDLSFYLCTLGCHLVFDMSSNMNEVIRSVLNFLLLFFYDKILHA